MTMTIRRIMGVVATLAGWLTGAGRGRDGSTMHSEACTSDREAPGSPSADRRNTMRSSRSVALVSMVLVSATPLLAKGGTIGIYAIVDKVAFEPDETSPERVRICGVFVVPVPMSSGRYKAPQRGCLYFRMAPGMERIAEHDWRDLKAF